VLDDGRFLKANILRRAPREDTFYRTAARAKQFSKPSKVDGFGYVVEE